MTMTVRPGTPSSRPHPSPEGNGADAKDLPIYREMMARRPGPPCPSLWSPASTRRSSDASSLVMFEKRTHRLAPKAPMTGDLPVLLRAGRDKLAGWLRRAAGGMAPTAWRREPPRG